MMLLEHDAKELLRDLGLNVPPAILVTGKGERPPIDLPAVVKAQVPVGGRGKAGGIRMVRDDAALDAAVQEILGLTIKHHPVRAVRIEQPVTFTDECYISFTIDPQTATVRILVSPEGGVDIESEEARDSIVSATARFTPDDISTAVDTVLGQLPARLRGPIRAAADGLIPAFFALDAIMLEINPLFITADGGWTIGDAKLVADDNAFERNEQVRQRIVSQPDLYPEALLKIEQDFDFVRLDEGGNVGLITTGAGLSMQLVDELVGRGLSPFNFCDIRTGMFRGDPARLIQVLNWIKTGPKVSVIMVNFFAGATDLAETTGLLIEALDRVDPGVPVVARLIGNNLDAALDLVAAKGNPIVVETDLDKAVEKVVAAAGTRK